MKRLSENGLLTIATLLAAVNIASAAEPLDSPSGVSARLDLDSSLPTPSSKDFARESSTAEVPAEFASAGSWWWTLGGSFADDFSNNQDFAVYGSVRHFIADGWEFGGQLNLRYIKQKGEDTYGINPVMIFRYHFYRTDHWTLFADAGIGVMLTTDNVPDGATSFNFTPRVGAGLTRKLSDSGARLELGVTWMHISNARIKGDRNNESRDAPQIYAGVIFPF